MRVLNDTRQKTYKVTCDCNAELEVEESDLEVGNYGLKYCICPCCNEKYYDDSFGEIKLNKNNLSFPRHYSCFEDGIKLKDEEINNMVRECIERFDKNDDEDFVRYVATGNTFVIVFKMIDDEEYNVFVSKNYYETFLPIDIDK